MMDRPTGPPVRSYRTSFQTDEDPISEGGIWLNGRTDGIDWADVIEASIAGRVIKGYINGVEMISATDDAFGQGGPGVGFNFFVGDTNVDHGFRYFEVDTYND